MSVSEIEELVTSAAFWNNDSPAFHGLKSLAQFFPIRHKLKNFLANVRGFLSGEEFGKLVLYATRDPTAHPDKLLSEDGDKVILEYTQGMRIHWCHKSDVQKETTGLVLVSTSSWPSIWSKDNGLITLNNWSRASAGKLQNGRVKFTVVHATLLSRFSWWHSRFRSFFSVLIHFSENFLHPELYFDLGLPWVYPFQRLVGRKGWRR